MRLSIDVNGKRVNTPPMTKFIDLSIPITTKVVSDPPVMLPQIAYMDHSQTWQQIAMFFLASPRKTCPTAKVGQWRR